jgi:hypothetical protein
LLLFRAPFTRAKGHRQKRRRETHQEKKKKEKKKTTKKRKKKKKEKKKKEKKWGLRGLGSRTCLLVRMSRARSA